MNLYSAESGEILCTTEEKPVVGKLLPIGKNKSTRI